MFCGTVVLHFIFHNATNTHRNVDQLICNINEFQISHEKILGFYDDYLTTDYSISAT
jgi:hypothetical protein